jgi:hypothetical protein
VGHETVEVIGCHRSLRGTHAYAWRGG